MFVVVLGYWIVRGFVVNKGWLNEVIDLIFIF